MKSEDIAKELDQQEQKKAALVSRIDNLFLEIQGAMPAAVAVWMREEMERRIKDHPETVQALGIDKLKVLKGNLNDLIGKLPEMVAAEFQDRNRWPHYIEVKEENASGSGNNEPYLDRIFRDLISSLGQILNEAGLLAESKGYYPSWQRKGKDQFRYSINPGMDRIPELKMKEYGKLLGEYHQLGRKINDARESLSAAKAKELWEAA